MSSLEPSTQSLPKPGSDLELTPQRGGDNTAAQLYRVTDIVARGGVRSLCVLNDVLTDNTLSLKPHLFRGARAQTGIVREAQALTTCRHPAIPRLYDIDVLPDKRPVLVLEDKSGHTLRSLLKVGEIAPQSLARALARIADVLHHCHQRGVVHRDLRPDNILLNGQDACLIDFDQSRIDFHLDDADTDKDRGTGRAPYSAPEQRRAPQLSTPATDSYAFGIMLCECGLHHDPRHKDLTYKLLQPDPKRRPNCAQIGEALRMPLRLSKTA